jgi:hypothetical protein
MRPELLKGHLDALLLAVLEPGPHTGTPSSKCCALAVTAPSICQLARSTRRCIGWSVPG